MKQEFDLTKILQIGDKVWSPLFGDGIIKAIGTTSVYPIIVSTKEDSSGIGFTHDGRYLNTQDGECLLFPSKQNRDWSAFCKFKKGDVVLASLKKDMGCKAIYFFCGMTEDGKYIVSPYVYESFIRTTYTVDYCEPYKPEK